MNISMTLTPESINAAIEKIKDFVVDMKTGVERGVQHASFGAVETAEKAYGDKAYDYMRGGSDHDKINVWDMPDTRRGAWSSTYTRYVVAHGKGVGVFEFGAGDLADRAHPLAKNAPFPVYPGSYSEINAREYIEWDYWVFQSKDGRKWMYKYIHPRRGLYEATKHVRTNGRTDFLRGYKRD